MINSLNQNNLYGVEFYNSCLPKVEVYNIKMTKQSYSNKNNDSFRQQKMTA
nr:MAG TPA: hypothetical protein [Caudoviricetes sp.]